MKKILSLFMIAVLLAGCFAFAGAESLPEKDLIILYTGDVHCAIDKGWGYAGLYAMKEALAKDHDVFLIDSGDHVRGETPGMLTRGEAISNPCRRARCRNATAILTETAVSWRLAEIFKKINTRGQPCQVNCHVIGKQKSMQGNSGSYEANHYGSF